MVSDPELIYNTAADPWKLGLLRFQPEIYIYRFSFKPGMVAYKTGTLKRL